MIEREFEKLKYKRDYLFNSKAKERNYFKNSTEGSEGFTWIDYRRNTMKWFNDKLNVIFSWKLLFQKVSYVLAVIGLIELFDNILFGGIITGLSVLSHLTYHYFKWKQSREIGNYGFALAIIHEEIERNYSLKLSVNP